MQITPSCLTSFLVSSRMQRYGVGEGGDDVTANLNAGKITLLVEHPVPIPPPAEEAPPPPMPLMLTAKVCWPDQAL